MIMKILRWLLCHLLFIILIVSLILLFVYRDVLKQDINRLFGNTSQTAEVEIVSSNQGTIYKRPDPVVVDTTSQDRRSDKTKQNTESAIPEAVSSGVEDRQLSDSQLRRPVNKPEKQPTEEVSDPWDRVLPADVDKNMQLPSVEGRKSESAMPIYPPENYDPEKNETETASLVNRSKINKSDSTILDPFNPTMQRSESASGSSEYYLILEQARQLQWDGNTGQAQAAYEKLMFDYPEQPEAAAELGNIFLQQGNRKAATWAYQNAIPRYLKLHREQEAINLMRFVSQYDPAIAESLQKKYW
jgi:hypothetical protein